MRNVVIAVAVVLALAIGYVIGTRTDPAGAQEEAQPAATSAFAAVPGEIGAQDISGPYQVQEGWPKDLSTLPGHEKWTWGAGQGSRWGRIA